MLVRRFQCLYHLFGNMGGHAPEQALQEAVAALGRRLAEFPSLDRCGW